MRTIIPALCALGLAASFSQLHAQEVPPKAAEKFIVHEWGVQVRSLAKVKPAVGTFAVIGDANLKAVLTPPAELIGELPPFVLRHGDIYKPQPQYRNWNKPVIHLYGAPGLEVAIEVRTALGAPLAYWPKPTLIEEESWMMGTGIKTAVGMKWSGKLAAEAGDKNPPPKVGQKHWWNTVRQVPGRYFQTEAGTERFVFYEGTAVQEPTITAKIVSGAVRGKRSGDALSIINSGANPSGPVIVILNDMTSRHFVVVSSVPSTGARAVDVEEADLLKGDGNEAALLAACAAQWKGFGMTEAESQAIVETWRPDLLDRPGVLVISRLPRELYDKMFPLTVTPKPDEVVRVGMVFDTLAGQGDRLAWVSALKDKMESWGNDLGDANFAVRTRAASRLAQAGDLAKELLEKLSKSGSAEVSSRAKALLEQLQPATVDVPTLQETPPAPQPDQPLRKTPPPPAGNGRIN